MANETLPMASEPTTVDIHTSPTTATDQSSPLLHSQHQYSLLQQQQQVPVADCLPCKLVGCAGFGGLGLYSFYQAQKLPKTLVARRLGLGLMGTAFVGAAVYRLTMPTGYRSPSPAPQSSSTPSSGQQ